MKLIKRIIFTILSLWISQLCFASQAPTLPDSYSGYPFSAAVLATGLSGYGIISSGLNQAKIEASAVFSDDINRLSSVSISNKGSVFFWQKLSKETTENTEISLNRIGLIATKESEKGYLTGLVLSYLYGNIAAWSNTPGNAYAFVSSGNGFAVDFAVNFTTYKPFIIGFNLKNILAYMFWDKYDTERLPFALQANLQYIYKDFKAVGSYERVYGNINQNCFNIGAEQAVNEFLTLRAGAIFRGPDIDKTAGFGVKIKQFLLSAAIRYNADKTSLYMVTIGAVTK